MIERNIKLQAKIVSSRFSYTLSQSLPTGGN